MKLKYRNAVCDLFYNTLGFGIYILTQQIILMPIMSKMLTDVEFSKITIYISVFAILTNVFGSELGIVRQIKKEDCDESSDYNRILVQLFPFLIIMSCFSLKYFGFNSVDIIGLTICVLLGNIRLYSAACFRINHDFQKIVIQNLIYFTGIVVGLGIMIKAKLIFIPFLCAEILCVVYSIIFCDFNFRKIKKTKYNKEIWIKFIDFGIISFLVNMTAYFDKIIIYPILGVGAVAIYFATSSMSKVISLITNPLHGVVLSWLKGNDDEFRNRITSLMIKISIPLILIVFVISVPITYISVRILYPQYLVDSIKLIIPICVGVAFSSMSSITKGMLLKYTDSKKLIYSYIIYIIVLIVAGVILSKIYGIVGFAVSTALANVVLSITFFVLLKKVIR